LQPARQSIRPPLTIAFRGADRGFFEDERHTVMLDGMIDNLRALAGLTGGSEDPETVQDAGIVAALFSRDGEAVFARFTGSFSLAIIAHESGDVVLVRDRFGDRPLFYGQSRAGWAWASEIKSLCPLIDRVALDPEGLRQAIHYRFVLGDTLIDGISQVMPASFVRLGAGRTAVETQYWKLEFRPSSTSSSLDSWADRVDAGLDACFARLRDRHRDIAILLSGGVDSSLLAAKAARSGFRTCTALTARWPGDNPELEAAASVARHVGIEHRIVDIEESDIEEMFPWITWRLEEPPRHYNSLVLAKLFSAATGQFDTLLSGHAADVLFGPPGIIGLDIFRRRLSQLEFIPGRLKLRLAALLGHSESGRISNLRKYLEMDEHEFTKSHFEIHYRRQDAVLLRRQLGPSVPGRQSVERFYDPLESATERFQRFDLYTFNQTHTQVFDRLGAPFGISVTSPFLAPEIVDIAVKLPSKMKADGRVSKPVLKALAARYFPKEWIYRPNQGFPTPTSHWLRGPLDSWRRALSGERTEIRGVVNTSAIRAGDVDSNYEAIWTAMTLEMFCRQYIDGEGDPGSDKDGVCNSESVY
jgi:asparagine synthase (glutamine-hydrolysing)